MTYSSALEYLHGLRRFGPKLGLASTLKLAALAGNPHAKLRFIHVAGTNGKGSTCAMLESIYRTAGLRVGLYTSPHLVAFGERIQVNRRNIPPADVARLVQKLQTLIAEKWPNQDLADAEPHPTFFEFVTVMALLYFLEQKCELVIWETGLGGRFDSTNIVTPLASVITNIQRDHEQWLGETISSIASEKAGIIKPGVPIVTGANAPDALNVIRAKAAEQGASLTLVGVDDVKRSPLEKLELPLPGEHQRMNAAVALATVRVLQPIIPIKEQAIISGLTSASWPGRLQLITEASGRKILLDGAHNPDGAQTLADAFQRNFPAASPTLILGTLRDKKWAEICKILTPLAKRICLVPVPSERSADTRDLEEECRRANPAATVQAYPSLAAALADNVKEPFLIITGSLYLVGEALELLGVCPPPAEAERALNEWNAACVSPPVGDDVRRIKPYKTEV
jgi:dihydrofolate synthase/folylpolyglutamate synthase